MDFSFYLIFAAIAGAARGAVSLIVEHPLDVIKTYWQTYPQYSSARTVALVIYRMKGWRGFYSGLLPNLIRVVLKQSYRYPLMLLVPLIYGAFIKSVMWLSLLTGVTIAVLEVFLITPLERLKVWLITFQLASGGVGAFFLSSKLQFLAFVYRGLYVTMLRQTLSWVVFLVVHDQLMLFVRDVLQIQQIGFVELMWISLAEATMNTAIMLPVDEIKSRLQRVGSHYGGFDEVVYIYRTYGFRGFYVAYNIRLLQYMIHAAFTVSLLESLKMIR